MIERRTSSISLLHRRTVYALTGLLWITGAVWIYDQMQNEKKSDLEVGSHTRQVLLMKVHGAAAMGFLILLGSLYPIHIRSGWRQRRNRNSGVSMIAVCLVLMASGWGLYYAGSESFREKLSSVHSWLGLALPVIIVLHVLLGKATEKYD